MEAEVKEKVTVVIPNYNGIKYVDKCLDSLKKQTYKEFKVIIIDNASTDGSLELIEENYEEFQLVKNSINTGFCKAVNQGIEIADTEYVLLLNNDTELDDNFLTEIVETMEKSDNIFSVSSKMISYHDRDILDDAGDGYTILGWQYQRGVGQSSKGYTKECDVFTACAGAALYRRNIFNKIGVFDEMHFAYMEDIDVGYRARINGYRNVYCPKAIVYHIGSATSGSKYNSFKVKLAARNNIFLLYKNMPVFQIIINSPSIILGLLIKYMFFKKIGFAKDYKDGIKEGIRKTYKLKKVGYKPENLNNYIRIELELIANTFEYVFDYVKRHM